MAPPETQWFYLGERAIDVELQGKRCRIIGISNHHYVKVAGLGRTIIDMTYVSVISKYPNLSEQLLELMYEQGNLTREKKYEMIHHLFSHLEKYPDMLDHVKSLPIFQRISLEINKRPDQIKTLAGEEIKISIVFGGRRGFF